MVVIGSGPGGHRAAIQAAKRGHRVALVERDAVLGGVSVNTGTIPSKSLRQAILESVGHGGGYRAQGITFAGLIERTHGVMEAERALVRDQLLRNGVRVFAGTARFTGPGALAVTDATDEVHLRAERIVIATGSRPSHPDGVDFNGRTILDSDGILGLAEIPASMVVVGGGVIGVEYASMFTALGTRVTLVNGGAELLGFCDHEIVAALVAAMRDAGATLRLGEHVVGVEEHAAGTVTVLDSGKRIAADVVLYSAGRRGATDALALDTVGLATDDRGLIAVDDHLRTSVDGIWAVGDVIGFPALAATSAEQGRLAANHAFGHRVDSSLPLLPYGIYAVPEISFVGRTEADLTSAGIAYEVGIARFRELARGQIMGETHGMLKLLVGVDRSLLGVHALGAGATELVHIGQAVMSLAGTVDYLVDAVFNYPTLAEAYKVAALDACNRLEALEDVEAT